MVPGTPHTPAPPSGAFNRPWDLGVFPKCPSSLGHAQHGHTLAFPDPHVKVMTSFTFIFSQTGLRKNTKSL